MPPTLHFARHAQVCPDRLFTFVNSRVTQANNNLRNLQGFHNLTPANHILHDPLLTPHGEQQSTNLLVNFPFHDNVELVVASPMRRTLYTAMLAFAKPLRDKKMNIVALPEVQETSDVPCDLGSELAALEEEVREKNLPVDLSLVSEGWNDKVHPRLSDDL